MEKKTPGEWITLITDIITIAFPAIIAVLAVLQISGAIIIVEEVEQITLIILGAASAIASVIYNAFTKIGAKS
jgi:hypothetical protein